MQLRIFTDGAARGNPGEAGAGVWIGDARGPLVAKSVYLGCTTNNVAEYMAFIVGLKEALNLGGQAVTVFCDSELLVRQIKGIYKVKDEKLKVLYNEARKILGNFTRHEIIHIPRTKNKIADELANKAIDGADRIDAENLDAELKALLKF